MLCQLRRDRRADRVGRLGRHRRLAQL